MFKKGLSERAVYEDVAKPISYFSEKEHERNNFLLSKDLDILIASSRKGRAKFYLPALILLGAEHGASRQEALSLEWPDIDFDYEGIGTINFFRTKNEKARFESLMPRTKEALLVWRDHFEQKRKKTGIKDVKSISVFTRIDATSIKRFDKAFRTARKDAGIKDLHFHDLRHTFCSNLLLSGSSLKDVKEMIGHNDLSMTDRYSHLTLEHKRHRQDKLAEHYKSKVGHT